MPSFCAVVNCSKRAERDQVRFFRIPAVLKGRVKEVETLSKERRERWVRSLKRGNLSETFLKNARICSNHFLKGAPAHLEDKDNPDWIPTQNMGYISINIKHQNSAERHARLQERRKCLRMHEEDATPKSTEHVAGPSTSIGYVEEEDTDPRNCVKVQTDLDMEHLCNIFSDLNFSIEKIQTLQQKLRSMELSEESFLNNDSKALYFTGFPKADMMFSIFNTVTSSFSTKCALSPFQQFLLTLMKLRLNLPFKYLSYRFSISPATTSDIFYKCIDILYARYKRLVFWPDRNLLQKNMPACFKENFGNRVAAVIDCFEIFTETPSGLLNTAHCWSNYKHHETVKFLIGISPQGTISYISEAWGGRTSDKYLTENCGFLNFILPGDVILADRGFLIKDAVEAVGGRLEIPAFTKGKSQLDPIDLESTRNIANVRIHVERIIGLLRKKYKICQGPIPISMLSICRDDLSALDKIMFVCSAFINLCPSQIPME
ncbi:hypothetical protein NQ317_006156 [Molorchus minor]|uniref:THAP-type domain-containing protein n=1 Tax=Molorchus minor TaxID=1323400 RepID=A0ABQ9IRX4_9CUCU|nr:hypothetical protein NQ317_006156 [Molorchus minor]